MSEFKEFPKITRFFEQEIFITEKIDGTNGLIYINDDLSIVRAGSRSRWISTTDDNFGFAQWVDENAEDLKNLGSGYHYGEWWGQGIQRKYGMSKKVFSLFNVHKWYDDSIRPACCDVVPILYQGIINGEIIKDYSVPITHSVAAKKYGIEFQKPEGIMIYFSKSGTFFKVPEKKGRKT